MTQGHYTFSWDLIGDLQKGRPYLGLETRLEILLLFQLTLQETLEKHFQSSEKVSEILFLSGIEAGKQFCSKFVGYQSNLDNFLKKLQIELAKFKIGRLRVSELIGFRELIVYADKDDVAELAKNISITNDNFAFDEGFLRGALVFYTKNILKEDVPNESNFKMPPPKELYTFAWSDITKIRNTFPKNYHITRLEMYRLFMFTVRDTLSKLLKSEIEADKLFYQAGIIAGNYFAFHLIKKQKNLLTYLEIMQKRLKDFRIGKLRLEKKSVKNDTIILCMDEDIDCAGLPDLGVETCHYDEGFIKGCLEFQTGEKYDVREIDCWCKGGNTCRFRALKTD